MKIALVAWVGHRVAMKYSLAPLFQYLYCTVLKKNSVVYLLLSTDAHQAITAVSVPYYTSENENLLICIGLRMSGIIFSIN